MLLTEYVEWVRYRNIRGTLSTPRRVEQALARVCHLICTAAGINKDSDLKIPFTVADFMPNEDGFAELKGEITLDEAVAKGLI
jgi:hypothetical protein